MSKKPIDKGIAFWLSVIFILIIILVQFLYNGVYKQEMKIILFGFLFSAVFYMNLKSRYVWFFFLLIIWSTVFYALGVFS